jgi:hypothetical protein
VLAVPLKPISLSCVKLSTTCPVCFNSPTHGHLFVTAQVNSLGGMKRKLEGELQALHSELDEALTELKNADELAKKVGREFRTQLIYNLGFC